MAWPEVLIACNTHADITDEAYQKQLVETWYRELPELFPDRADWSEPIRGRVEKPEDLLRYFRSAYDDDEEVDFIWRRTRAIKGWGSVRSSFNKKFPDDMNRWKAFLHWKKTHDWGRVIRIIAPATRSDHAWLHLKTRREFSGRPHYLEWVGDYIYNIDIRSWEQPLHMLSWADYFSSAFCLRYFGRKPGELAEDIRARAPEVILEATDDHLLIQLTERLRDVEDDYEGFCAVRDKVYDALGREHFAALMKYPPDSTDFMLSNIANVPLGSAMEGLATMLCEDDGTPLLPGLRREDCARLDFTPESVKVVDAWLGRLQGQALDEEDRAKITLRAGAYLGEVIRRNAVPSGPIRWRERVDLMAGFFNRPPEEENYADDLGLMIGIRDIRDERCLIYFLPLAWVQKRLADAPAGFLERKVNEALAQIPADDA